MRLKVDPFPGNFDQGVEAENLEASTVRQQWMIPVHETVQAPQPPDPLMSGPQVEMVGIGKNDLRSHLPKLLRSHGLNGRLGAHRNKGRRAESTMGSNALSQPGPRFWIFLENFKLHGRKCQCECRCQ